MLLVSLPVRECGLKFTERTGALVIGGSLPVRECGLKYVGRRVMIGMERVTPRAGVWIEI